MEEQGYRFKGIDLVAVSPDSKFIVSASWDGGVKIRGLLTGNIIRTLKGRKIVVKSVAISPDGKFIVIGYSNRVKIREFSTGKLYKTLKRDVSTINSVAVSPNGKIIASGSIVIKIWDIFTGNLIQGFRVRKGIVNSVVFSPNGKFIVSGSNDNTVKVWELASGKLYTLEGHNGNVNSVAVSPNGKFIVSGSNDNTVKVWELASGKLHKTLEGHNGNVNSVAVSPNGQFTVSGSNDNTVKVWELTSGKLYKTLKGHKKRVNSIAISPDGQFLVSGSDDMDIKVWNFLDIKKSIELEKRLPIIKDYVYTQGNAFSDALKEIKGIINIAESYQLLEILNKAKARLNYCKKLVKCTNIIMNLPAIFKEISFDKIISRSKTGLRSKALEYLIEYLIKEGEINARIKGDSLVFLKKESPSVLQFVKETDISPSQSSGKDVEILRGDVLSIIREYEFLRGQVRFKIGLINNSGRPLTSFRISFGIPDALKWIYHEPKYERKGDSIYIPKLGVNEKKVVSLYLEPINCLNSPVNATVSFFDAKDRPQAITMKPKMISITCPLFFTKEEANLARVKRLQRSLTHQDKKIFPIANIDKISLIFSTAVSVLGGYDIKLISKEFSEKDKFGEAWFFGTTKVKKNRIITYILLDGESKIVEIEVSANDEEQITSFLAELGNQIRDELIKHNIINSEEQFYDISMSIHLNHCPYCWNVVPAEFIQKYLDGGSIKCNYCKETLSLK